MCSMSAAGSCRSRPLVARRRFGFQRPVCLAHQWLGLQQRRLPQRLRRYFGSSPEHRRYVNRWAADVPVVAAVFGSPKVPSRTTGMARAEPSPTPTTGLIQQPEEPAPKGL